MPRYVPRVNRELELQLFQRMAQDECPERIFALSDRGRKGKTFLMDLIEQWCWKENFICGRIDFRDSSFDFFDLALLLFQKIRRSAGKIKTFDALEVVDAAFEGFKNLLKSMPFSPLGVACCQEKGSMVEIDDSIIEGRIAGRDIVEEGARVSYAYFMNDVYYQELSRAVTNSFVECLRQLSLEANVAVLLDTFEHASSGGDWLIKRVLSRLRDEWPSHLVVCIFGRQLPDFTGWEPLVLRQCELSPFALDAHTQLVRAMGIDLDEDEIRKHFRRLKGDPASTAWFYSVLA